MRRIPRWLCDLFGNDTFTICRLNRAQQRVVMGIVRCCIAAVLNDCTRNAVLFINWTHTALLWTGRRNPTLFEYRNRWLLLLLLLGLLLDLLHMLLQLELKLLLHMLHHLHHIRNLARLLCECSVWCRRSGVGDRPVCPHVLRKTDRHKAADSRNVHRRVRARDRTRSVVVKAVDRRCCCWKRAGESGNDGTDATVLAVRYRLIDFRVAVMVSSTVGKGIFAGASPYRAINTMMTIF